LGRQNRAHDLLAVFPKQQDVRAWELVCHDEFGSPAEFAEIAHL
jgi:hypothetical protein